MKNRRKSDEADSALGMLQNRLKESSQVIQSLAAARTEQPANPKRSSFANYVKDTLLQFSERKYKKAKSTITKLIMDLDENDSESEDLQYHFDRGNVPACSNLQSHSTQSLASQGYVPPSSSQNEFQHPSNMWRHTSSGRMSPWSSEFMQLCNQPPNLRQASPLYQQQPFPVQHPQSHQQSAQWSSMPPPLPSVAANPGPTSSLVTASSESAMPSSSSPLCNLLASATQVITQNDPLPDTSP